MKELKLMKLKKVKTLEIVPASLFAFNPTFHKPVHFTSGDNECANGFTSHVEQLCTSGKYESLERIEER